MTHECFNLNDLVPMKKCAECGKIFGCYDVNNWAYRRAPQKRRDTDKYYCSWRCFRAPEIREEAKPKTYGTFDVAIELEMEQSYITKWCISGVIKAVKKGRAYIIDEDEFKRIREIGVWGLWDAEKEYKKCELTTL